MSVKLDIIEGRVFEDANGIAVTRHAVVDGLSGSASERMHKALEMSGMPRRGDVHPTIAGLTVDTVEIRPYPGRSTSAVQAEIVYRGAGGTSGAVDGDPEFELGTVLVSKQTNRDAYGKLVVITWTIPQGTADGQLQSIRTARETPTLEVQAPLLTVRVRRTESSNPAEKSLEFAGSVGELGGKDASGPFGGSGGPKWLCSRIEGRSTDGGATWDVIYEFTYNPEGWAAQVELRVPDSGEHALFASSGVKYGVGGYKLDQGRSLLFVPIYPKRNFKSLKLPKLGV